MFAWLKSHFFCFLVLICAQGASRAHATAMLIRRHHVRSRQHTSTFRKSRNDTEDSKGRTANFISAGSEAISPTRWSPKLAWKFHGLSISKFASIGDALSRAEQSVMWWIGDWWAYGDKQGHLASVPARLLCGPSRHFGLRHRMR
jgi:hypothetical protein